MRVKRLLLSFVLWGVAWVVVGSIAGAMIHEYIHTHGWVSQPHSFLSEYLIVFSTILIFLVLPLIFWMGRYILRPLERLVASNRAALDGDYRRAIIPEGDIPKDEMGLLMETRNRMLESILHSQERLERELRREKVLKDLLNILVEGRVEEGMREGAQTIEKELEIDGKWWAMVFGGDESVDLFIHSPGFPDTNKEMWADHCRRCFEELGGERIAVRDCPAGKELGRKVHTLCLFMMGTDSRPFGTIHLEVPEGFHLPNDTRFYLEGMASSISLALMRHRAMEELKALNTTLEERIRQRTFELEVLYDLSKEIGYIVDYRELLRLILRYLDRILAYDVAAAFVVESEGKGYIFLNSRAPLTEGLFQELREKILKAYTNLGGERCSLRVEKEVKDGQAPSIESLSSSFSVPFIAHTERRRLGRDEVLGLLFVGKEEGAFTEDHVRVLYTLANHSTISLQKLKGLLDEERRRVIAMVEHLPVGVAVLDRDRRVIFSNPLAEEYGKVCGLHEGKECTLFGDREIEEIIREGEWEEVQIGERVFEITGRKVKGIYGGEVILIIRDVTKEKEYERRQIRQERLAVVGQLAAGIAHDFNNLLTSIIGFAEILLDRDLPEEVRERVKVIYDQGKRGGKLVQQILDFSRKSLIQREPFDLLPFLKEVTRFLQTTLTRKIRVSLQAQPGSYWIEGDPVQIHEAIVNLAINARDAMPDGGDLRINLSRLDPSEDASPFSGLERGEWLLLTVEDTGTGIPKEVLPKIFEPFFTTKEVGKGTGLGLAQVYGIVKQHGGYIDVDSKVGRGTTFRIYLPLGRPDPLRGIDSRQEKAVDVQSGKTILVVDDERNVLILLEEVLKGAGYRVLTAQSGRQALRIFAESKVDLVITDLIMPEMDGFRVAEELKRIDPSVKVLLLTGYPLKREELLSKGINQWIMKPLTSKTILSKVVEVLGKNQL